MGKNCIFVLQSSLYQLPSGTSGDDTLNVNTTVFGALDGNAGSDRVVFLQQGAIDLSNLSSGNTLSNIEVLDSTNGVSNALTVDADLVTQINTDDRTGK